MWGVVTCVIGKLIDEKAANYTRLLDIWENDNSKIITSLDQ